MPMFPLGSVLLPHQVLPLHVFEPRYRALVADCLAADRSFGVVLIERGSEVGGGDARFDIGCRATIVEAEQTEDGRWGLVCEGGDRLRIVEWLPDDPYPRAEVEVVDDGEWTADAGVALDGARAALQRVVDLATELGGSVDPAILELPGPPTVDQWVLAARAPIAELDRLAVLRAETPERRLDVLAEELSSIAEVLASRLGGG